MPEDRSTPRLLFCIGAQKAGTTWLYKHFEKYPEIHFHRVKELQFFNNIRPVRNAPRRNNAPEALVVAIRNRIAAAERNLREHPGKSWVGHRIEVLREIITVLEGKTTYMEVVTSSAPPETQVVADMTPEYSLLGPETYSEMLALAPDVRFIFLMRDPVDRAWSQVRFAARVGRTQPEKIVQRIIADPDSGFANEFWLRSRYDLTLQALESAVPSDRTFVDFYESFFTRQKVADVLDFAGLRQVEPDLDTIVFGTRPKPLDPAFEDVAIARLKPVYADIQQRYGEAVPGAWRRV